MNKFFFLAIFSVFVFGSTIQSCNKHTCPTYATSGQSKGVKKALKQANGAYSKKSAKKNKKTAKGNPSSGI